MKVAEVMSRGVDPVDPAATVQTAATQMAELDVGAVLVGTSEKIDAFADLMRPLGLQELARTGVAALSRGKKS